MIGDIMRKSLSRVLEVDVADPEDGRKRRLLNILLLGGSLLGLLIISLTGLLSFLGAGISVEDVLPIYAGGAAFLLGSVIIYLINRFMSGSLAGLIFLVMWVGLLPFLDTPKEVANGRTLFVFTIPIVMASVLLRPYSTFLFAGISSLIISLIAISIHDVPNVPAILGFFMIALVSWLSASSLENVLKELMQVNKDLDKRVSERTQELSAALARERMEAGRNQAILEDIADGVVVLDKQERVTVVNPAMLDIIEQPANAIMGKRLDDWLGDTDLNTRDRENLLRSLKASDTPAENLKVQWGKRTLSISIAPVRIAGEEQIGSVAVFHDFTHEAEVDRMKSDFVAMVSHELRTPLNSILGYADMLLEGVYGKLDERQNGIVDRVMANTHKLLTIVNDLLDQAQIEAGRLAFRNRHFRPSELADYVHGVMDSIVQTKKLRLEVQIADDLPNLLYGDPQRLNQVLINLVNNAVKFTERGSIYVRIARVDEEHWAMQVSDTGVGIPSEAQRVIFDPFRQVDMEVTRRPGGIGLGLSIVKRLVNLMEGEISVSSQIGSGSTFTVILPLYATEKETIPNG